MAAAYSPVVYATAADLAQCGVPPQALRGLLPTQIDRALRQASRFIDAYLAQRYQLPLGSWDDDLTQWCCFIAAYRLLSFRGWAPNDPHSASVVSLYTEAIKSLESVKNGALTLNVTTTTPDPTYEPDASTTPLRGI